MTFAFDEFELDSARLELRRGGRIVKADALVLKVLAALVQNAGQLVTKDELVDAVWEGRAVADNVLTVSMARLRKTLGHRRGEREFVATVYGRGYRFVRDVREVEGTAPLAGTAGAVVAVPFVGREHVMTRLRNALNEARAGRGRACVLLGEPGIGKTRLAEMLEREAALGQTGVAWGYCREAGDTPPLRPFLRLLRAATESGAASESAMNDWENTARARGIDAIVHSLARAAERTPWLFVLEDLHRADAASLELLHLLLDEIARTRILIVATLRHERARHAPRADTHLPQVLGHRNCERIELERLREADVSAYVRTLVPDADAAVARAVFEKSEGNPFFMSELSRQLGAAERADAAALAVPDSALELIRQHVATLGSDTHAVLVAAAAIGRSFELPLLSAVTARDASDLIAALDDAIAADVVVAAPDSMTAFAFAHELLRTVLYDALAPSEQRALHARIAVALDQRLHAGDAIAASELAYHFHAALPAGDLRKTVDFCRAAAVEAGRLFAYPDVVRYTRHALEALDLIDSPSVRLRMRLLHTISLYARGHARVESERAAREEIRLAREHADGPALVRAASLLNLQPGFKPLAGAAENLEHALSLLEPADKDTRSIALAVLAVSAPHCWSAERSSELVAEALALAREGGVPTVLHPALRCKLYLQGGPGHEDGNAVADELERIAQQHPTRLPILPTELAWHRALLALQSGDLGTAAAALDRAVARARTLRLVEWLWHCERFRALAMVNAGALGEGCAALEALHRRAAERSIINTDVFCAFDRAVVLSEFGATAAPAETLRGALEFAREDPPSVWAFKLRALCAAGLLDEARSALRAIAPADLARLPCDVDHLGTLGHVARAAIVLGARDYAQAVHALLSRYPDRFAGQVSFLCEGAVPQLLGMLAYAGGERDAASEHFAAGLAMNERAGLLPRAAETRLQLARCATGRRAADLARAAHASATELGMQHLAEQAAMLLRGAPAT